MHTMKQQLDNVLKSATAQDNVNKRMEKARKAKAEKQMAKTNETITVSKADLAKMIAEAVAAQGGTVKPVAAVATAPKTVNEALAAQIEAIENPAQRAVYTAAVTEALNSQRQNYTGLVPKWKLQKACGTGTYEAAEALCEAGVLKRVITEVSYIPVLLDKGVQAAAKKDRADVSHITPDDLVAALRRSA